MKTVKAKVFPVSDMRTMYLADMPTAPLYVHSAPGHLAVVIDFEQRYKRSKTARVIARHGARVELSSEQTVELIEALEESLSDMKRGVCR